MLAEDIKLSARRGINLPALSVDSCQVAELWNCLVGSELSWKHKCQNIIAVQNACIIACVVCVVGARYTSICQSCLPSLTLPTYLCILPHFMHLPRGMMMMMMWVMREGGRESRDFSGSAEVHTKE